MCKTPPFADGTPLSCFPFNHFRVALTGLWRSFDQGIGARTAIISILIALISPGISIRWNCTIPPITTIFSLSLFVKNSLLFSFGRAWALTKRVALLSATPTLPSYFEK